MVVCTNRNYDSKHFDMVNLGLFYVSSWLMQGLYVYITYRLKKTVKVEIAFKRDNCKVIDIWTRYFVIGICSNITLTKVQSSYLLMSL